MTTKNFLSFSISIIALFAFAGIAAAQTSATAPTLQMNANVVTAMSLTISTDTGNSGVTVGSAGNDFSVDLGDVNGLGTGSRASGVSVAVNSTNATYTTPINLTPNFSGYSSGEGATIKRLAGNSGDEAIAGEGSTAANISSLPTTATQILSTLVDGSLNTRYVGFHIDHGHAAGAIAATVIYSITVE
jgi:hypothetical protein